MNEDEVMLSAMVRYRTEEEEIQKRKEIFDQLSSLNKSIYKTQELIEKYEKQIDRQLKVLEKYGLNDLRCVPVVSLQAELFMIVDDLRALLKTLIELRSEMK